MGDTRLEICRI